MTSFPPSPESLPQSEFEVTLQNLLSANKSLHSNHRLSIKRGTETNCVYGEQRLREIAARHPKSYLKPVKLPRGPGMYGMKKGVKEYECWYTTGKCWDGTGWRGRHKMSWCGLECGCWGLKTD